MYPKRHCWIPLYLCGTLAALTGSPAAAGGAPDTQRYAFEVLLEGKPIGTHLFSVERDAGGIERVRSEAKFEVKLLGITFYRYQHRAEEHWREGCLAQIEAATNDNGSRLEVRGAADTGGFRLQLPAPAGERAGCIAAYAYWDPQRLLQQNLLLNPQTGRFDAVRFDDLGEEQLLVRGEPRTARRYRLRGPELAIDLWYSPEGQWLQLASTAGGDRRLLYRLSG